MGLSIPSQFQAEGFRFVKLGSSGEGLKKPFEFFWDSLTLEDARRRYAEELAAAGGDKSKSKKLQAGEPSRLTNYGVDDPALLQHLQRGGNYGIVNGTGPNGAGLATLDADNLLRLAELVDLSLLPPTMEAGRRGEAGELIPERRHFHFLSDLEGKHHLRDPETGEDLGDLRGSGGYQVVGPGSLHPSGARVEVLWDRPLAEISGAELLRILKPVLDDRPKIDRANLEGLTKKRPPTATDKDPFGDVSILDVIDVTGFKESGGQFFGEHPIHGSETGHNLVVNPAKNSWWCGRHETGGGPALWLAVEGRIIDCSKARSGALRGEKFLQTLDYARSRGLIPDDGRGESSTEGARDLLETLEEKLSEDPSKIEDPDVKRALLYLRERDRIKYALLVKGLPVGRRDLDKGLDQLAAKLEEEKAEEEEPPDEPDEEIKAEAARIVSEGRSFEYICKVWQKRHLGDTRAGKVLIVSTGTQSCSNTAGIHVILNGPRGCGKSDILQKASALLPPKHLLFGDMSPQAIYYFAQEMPDGAVVAFDDVTFNDTYAAVQKRCTTRFQEGAEHRVVLERGPWTFKTKPRISFWCTSVDRQFDEQLQDRYFAVNVEDSPEHKAAVIEFMKARDAGIDRESEERETRICRAIIRDLKDHLFEVVVPFADRITLLPGVGERGYNIISDMVKAFCAFRYAVRETDDRGRLVATEEDFEDAKALFDDAEGHSEEKYTEPEKKVLRGLINCAYVATLENLSDATKLSSGRLKDILNGRGRDEQKRYGLLAKCPVLTVERVSETVYFEPEPGKPKSKTVTRNEYRLDRAFTLSEVYNSLVYLEPATRDDDVPRREVDVVVDVKETDGRREVDVDDVIEERERENTSDTSRGGTSLAGGVGTSGEKFSSSPKTPEDTSTTPKGALDNDLGGVNHYVGEASGYVGDASERSAPKKDDKLPQVEGETEESRAPTSEDAERIRAIAERLAKNYPEVSPPMISSKTADGGGAVIPHRTVERWFQLEGWKKSGSRLNGGDAWVPPAAGVV